MTKVGDRINLVVELEITGEDPDLGSLPQRHTVMSGVLLAIRGERGVKALSIRGLEDYKNREAWLTEERDAYREAFHALTASNADLATRVKELQREIAAERARHVSYAENPKNTVGLPIEAKQPLLIDGFPRRNRTECLTPAERAILEVITVVEGVGCDELLTDAVILLGKARDKVADFVDRSASK